jgi:diadenosine tetraphosphate (Ap4A) HIT family hydrolase
MNPTIEKFGYPATLLREFEHWLVLLRPAQVTLGSLVLAAKSEATAYGDLPRARSPSRARRWPRSSKRSRASPATNGSII